VCTTSKKEAMKQTNVSKKKRERKRKKGGIERCKKKKIKIKKRFY